MAEAGSETKPAAASAPRGTPDWASLGGIAVALVGILGGMLLENGKIKERWAEINALALMQQLGVIPSA